VQDYIMDIRSYSAFVKGSYVWRRVLSWIWNCWIVVER